MNHIDIFRKINIFIIYIYIFKTCTYQDVDEGNDVLLWGIITGLRGYIYF